MARLNKIWKSSISFPIKLKLYKALVVSILTYGCEAWTLMAETERRIQAFEYKCWRKLLGVSYREHKTNAFIRECIENLAGPQEPLLATIKRRKLSWFGHVNRHNNLPKTIMQGTVEGSRRRGRQRKSWFDNIREWSQRTLPELLRLSEDRTTWKALARRTALISPRRLNSHGNE